MLISQFYNVEWTKYTISIDMGESHKDKDKDIDSIAQVITS
jgi:hypothetical protein